MQLCDLLNSELAVILPLINILPRIRYIMAMTYRRHSQHTSASHGCVGLVGARTELLVISFVAHQARDMLTML